MLDSHELESKMSPSYTGLMIQKTAKIICGACAIVLLLFCVFMFSVEKNPVWLMRVVIEIGLCWLCYLLLYGFGDFLWNMQTITQCLSTQNILLNELLKQNNESKDVQQEDIEEEKISN